MANHWEYTKFRGRKTDGNKPEWVYGDYVYEEGSKQHFIVTGFDPYKLDFIYVMVDGDTVGQYIKHKDDNGTEIYEGDIAEGFLADAEGAEYVQGEIIWNYKGAFVRDYCIEPLRDDLYELSELDSVQVKGNVHDRPENVKEAVKALFPRKPFNGKWAKRPETDAEWDAWMAEEEKKDEAYFEKAYGKIKDSGRSDESFRSFKEIVKAVIRDYSEQFEERDTRETET
jgi:hypothetical protein